MALEQIYKIKKVMLEHSLVGLLIVRDDLRSQSKQVIEKQILRLFLRTQVCGIFSLFYDVRAGDREWDGERGKREKERKRKKLRKKSERKIMSLVKR